MYDESKKDPNEEKAKRIISLATKAFSDSERQNCESTWAELAEFMLPNQQGKFFGDSSRGVKRDTRVFDSTAIMSNRDLASAMHSTITNPAMQWSKLRFKQEDLNEDEEASAWIQKATKEIHSTLNDTNFDSQIGECYQSYSGLATMVLYQEDDDEQFWNFMSWNLGEVALVENKKGIVDTVHRKFTLKLKQAYEKFGAKIGEEHVKKLETDPLMDLEFYQSIYPRDAKDVKINDAGFATPESRPFASCYVMVKGSRLVKEDGFYEFPVYAVRWAKLPGEVYGFGPGHIARPDCRTLNKLREESLKAMAKAVNPSIISSQNNVVSADLRPGKITTVRRPDQFKEFITQTRFDAVKLEVEDLKGSIKSAFYVDKLLLPPRTETGEMTAYEIQQRLQQMQVILGPVLSRLNSEFLAPFVMRCLKSLLRAGRIPPIPDSVLAKLPQYKTGQKAPELDIMFVNSLARSQQLSELQNVQTFVQEVGAMAQLNPNVLDKPNWDGIIDYIAKVRNIDQDLLVSDKEVAAARDQKQKMQQAQMALGAGGAMSEMAKNLGAGKGQ